MKAVIAFVGINAVLIGANLVGARVALELGLALQRYAPSLAEEAWPWMMVGFAAAAAGAIFAIAVAFAVSRRH